MFLRVCNCKYELTRKILDCNQSNEYSTHIIHRYRKPQEPFNLPTQKPRRRTKYEWPQEVEPTETLSPKTTLQTVNWTTSCQMWAGRHHVTSPITWPLDLPRGVLYRWSIVTIAQLWRYGASKILVVTTQTIWGHVTSSVTWPLDVPTPYTLPENQTGTGLADRLCRWGHLKFLPESRLVVGRSSVFNNSLCSCHYTPLRYVRNIACAE